MAITVEGFTFAVGDFVQDITITAPTGIQAGDFLYIIAVRDPTIDDPLYTFSASGWSQHVRHWTNYDVQIQTLYRVADGTEGDVTLSSGFGRDTIAWYLRISGVDTSSPFNVNGTFVDGLPPISIPSVTTGTDGCLAFALFAFDGGDGDPYTLSGTGWPTSIPANQYLEESDIGSSIGGFWLTKEIPSAGATQDLSVSSSVGDGSGGFQFALTPSTVSSSTLVSGVDVLNVSSFSGAAKANVSSVSGVSVV